MTSFQFQNVFISWLLCSLTVIWISSSCRTLPPLGSCCVMVNDGISGEKLKISSNKMLEIDSVFASDESFKITGYNLFIYSKNGNSIFSSNTNKITPEMKTKLWDDPQITKLVFADFKIAGNQRILKNSYFKNKKIQIIINNCPICP